MNTDQIAAEAAERICFNWGRATEAEVTEEIKAAIEKAEKSGWERGYQDALASPFDAGKEVIHHDCPNCGYSLTAHART